jgi:hypothetical protein
MSTAQYSHPATVWTYKDGWRYHWRITLRKTDVLAPTLANPRHVYRYDIEREPDGGDGFVSVYTGDIKVVGADERPTLQDVLSEFAAYVTAVVIDCSVHGVSVTGEEASR